MGTRTLAILIDLDVPPVESFLSQLTAFLNCLLLLSGKNKFLLIAYNRFRIEHLVTDDENLNSAKQRLTDWIETFPTTGAVARPKIAKALSVALCYFNKIQFAGESQILILAQSHQDEATQYIPFMSCVFVAKKKGIVIDSFVLSVGNSSFLQQAALITGGLYIKPTDQLNFLDYSLKTFSCPPSLRKLFPQPIQDFVNLSGPCFCHQKNN